MTAVLPASQASIHLPLEVTSFVGRRQDRSRIRQLMENSRLVTLTGFGGIGKTRLALRVTHDLRRIFPDGVYFVSLGELHRDDRVADQIAASLGLEGRARHSAAIGVTEYLRERTALLVLDNCEHVIDVAAQIADMLLHTCPAVRLLTTSREPLRIAGESVYAVAPLAAPDPSSGPTPLQTYEAVQLFVERAKAVAPDFELADANRDAVAAICRKLEGIPLALELAAARLRALSPAELDNQLSERWEVLGRGSRTAPYRHSTMAACIDWSFELCTPAERLLWAKAAVFLDGFELDAATAVCSEAADGNNVRDLLSSLVDKSVLTTTRQGAVTRFWLLQPLRQRGLRELSALGRTLEIRRRHRDFYLELAARAHMEWFSQHDWVQRSWRELGNLREALDFCASEPGEADAGLRAMPHIIGLGTFSGLLRHCRQWSNRLLERGEGDPEARALALRTACWWAATQGDVDAAASFMEQGRALATQVSGQTQHLLTQAAGFVALYQGHLERAEKLLAQAAEGLEASGDPQELAQTTMLLAVIRLSRGDVEGALAYHKRCLEIIPTGELALRSWSMWAAALALSTRGDVEDATALLRKSLELKRLTSERLGIALTLEELACLAAESDPEHAAVLMGAAQNEWDKLETSTAAVPGLDLRHRQATTTARTLLGDEAFGAGWSRGQALHQAAAISFALGEKPPPERPRGKDRSPHTPLTRREQQIAGLIHQGLGNREIAEALVISPRTAETHVENILTKLGFTSRAQVASWVAEQHYED